MAVAALQGMLFERAIERLTDLALVDVRQSDMNSPPRYSLHPLVRAFAGAKLKEQPEFEQRARDRWVSWYIQLVRQVGFCWDNLSKLELLDPDHETIHAVIEWALHDGRYTETLALTKGIQYFYNVRGLWDKKLPNNLRRAEAARHLADPMEQIEALADHVQMLSKQGNVAEARTYLEQLRELTEGRELPGDVFFVFQHAIALYWMAAQNLPAAQEVWENILADGIELSIHRRISARHWLALCLYRQNKLTEAKQLYREVLYHSLETGYQRSIVFSRLGLAIIDLDQGDLDGAAHALKASSDQAHHYLDRSCIAHIQYAYARLDTRLGNLSTAHAALTEAIDLFERLGMWRQLAEARAELVDLDVRMRDSGERMVGH
jgi:LuxR family glucitol operon transcriptional activator